MRSTKLAHDATWIENGVANYKKLAIGYLLKELHS